MTTFLDEEQAEKYVERAMEQAKDLARFVEQSMKDEQSGKKLYYQQTGYIHLRR